MEAIIVQSAHVSTSSFSSVYSQLIYTNPSNFRYIIYDVSTKIPILGASLCSNNMQTGPAAKEPIVFGYQGEVSCSQIQLGKQVNIIVILVAWAAENHRFDLMIWF